MTAAKRQTPLPQGLSPSRGDKITLTDTMGHTPGPTIGPAANPASEPVRASHRCNSNAGPHTPPFPARKEPC